MIDKKRAIYRTEAFTREKQVTKQILNAMVKTLVALKGSPKLSHFIISVFIKTNGGVM
jgi:hypothetical protein